MKTLRVTTKRGGVLADVTSVTLADKPAGQSPTYGVRRTDTAQVVVAAGTAVPKVSTGVYEYAFDQVSGVPYEWRFCVLYGGESFIGGGTWTAPVTPPAAVLELSDHDEILVDDVDAHLAAFGEDVVVYPPAGDSRSVVGIIVRGKAAMEKDPRTQLAPTAVQLPNSATTGISGAEWNNRFELDVPRTRGGPAVRMRTLKAISQDAAMITWELA